MRLNHWDLNCCNRVGDRVRIVRICAGIDYNTVVVRARVVNGGDDLALTIVLHAIETDAQIARDGCNKLVDLCKCQSTVDLGLTFAEQIEIWPVNDEYAHLSCFSEGKAVAFGTGPQTMPDLIVSASAPQAGIAIVAAITTDLVTEIRSRHDLSPLVTAAVGRLTTGTALFGVALKGRERITLQMSGDGPVGSIAADAWLLEPDVLGARGYAQNPRADLPLNAKGKFDVAGAIGTGSLQVTKSYDVGQPYVGVVPLYSGEVAEDIAAYLVNSEQIPSVVALGVLADPDGVRAAGGVLAQVLPGADERAIAALEERALAMPPITKLISEGADAHAILNALAGPIELRSHRTLDVRFACTCTREKVEAALLSMGADELRTLASERSESEASCEFCKKSYTFTADELRKLAERTA
jgi:molecular chaperone Hsp33